MTFTIIFSQDSMREFKKLDNLTAKRLLDKLESIKENPYHFFERLAGREEYKARVGDYRLLAKILPNEKSIFVLSLGHRKNIYKK